MTASASYPRATLRLAFLLTLLPSPGVGAAASGDQNQPGVLLLTNGHVLQGVIRRDGDFFHVVVPHGRLSVRANQVQRVAANLEEIYQQERQALDLTDFAVAARLAGWCLKQGLFAEAEHEIARIEAAEPQNRQVPMLRQQLAMAKAAAATAPAATATTRPRNGTRRGRTSRSVGGLSGTAVRQSARGHERPARHRKQRPTVLAARQPARRAGAEGGVEKQLTPRDPFDPAVFNRRYWPGRALQSLAP